MRRVVVIRSAGSAMTPPAHLPASACSRRSARFVSQRVIGLLLADLHR